MLDERSVKLSSARLDLALEELAAAELSVDAKMYRIANTRSYYAVFHAIRAILALDDIDFKTHSKVIGYFNKNYVHSGVFDPIYTEIATLAFDSRNQSDYEDFYSATREEAENNANNAKTFVESVEDYIKRRLEHEFIQRELADKEAAADIEGEYDVGEDGDGER